MKRLMIVVFGMLLCIIPLSAGGSPEVESVSVLDRTGEYMIKASPGLDIMVHEHAGRLRVKPVGRDAVFADVQVRDLLELQELSSEDTPGNILHANKGLNRFDTIRFSYRGEVIDTLLLVNIDVALREDPLNEKPKYGRLPFEASKVGSPVSLIFSLSSIQQILDEYLYNFSDQSVSEDEREIRMNFRSENMTLPIEERIFYLIPNDNPKKVFLSEMDDSGRPIIDGDRLGTWYPINEKSKDYDVDYSVTDDGMLTFSINTLPVDDAMHVGR